MTLFSERRGPLRLGAVDWAEAAPLVAGLKLDSDVELEIGTPESLVERLVSAELDAALVPPLHAWRIEGTRFIPGIALSRRVADSPSIDDALDVEPSELPEVLLVWACRFRAPYPEIRRRLVMAGRATDLPASVDQFHYVLGSDESNALRAMLLLAKTENLIADAVDLYFC